ncbi:MAG: hypothetical protein KL801_10890 [Mesorhizobium sp.]|nr:hypothetical protein [Mesorhizobium sp.]
MFAFRVPVGSFLRVSLILAASAGTSAADSLIALPEVEPAALPSFIAHVEPEATPIEALEAETPSLQDNGEAPLAISTSVIAFGADAIPVSSDEVASITADEVPAPEDVADAMPLAIRGTDGDGLVSLVD